MELPTQYYYIVKHPPGFWVQISINDLPFYRRWSDHHVAPSGAVNHWLLEGENEVRILLVEPDPPHQRSFKFEFCIQKYEDDSQLLSIEYPNFLDAHPAVERSLPIFHRQTFRFDETSPRPIWRDAPVTDFPIEGTDAQRAAVFKLYDAKQRRDIDQFVTAGEIKASELQRFYGPQAHLAPSAVKANYTSVLNEPWDIAPLDWNDLVFERRGGGRTAYVTRKDGGPALFARHQRDKGKTWEVNPHLTQVQGTWRIFF